MRPLPAYLTFWLAPFVAAQVQPAPTPAYSITDITELGGVYDLNNAGEIVGERSGDCAGSQAFRFKDNLLTVLDVSSLGTGSSAARGINDSHEIVGSFLFVEGGAEHGFIFTSGESSSDLHGTMSAGVVNTRANSINNMGEIAGITVAASPGWRAAATRDPSPEGRHAGFALSCKPWRDKQ